MEAKMTRADRRRAILDCIDNKASYRRDRATGHLIVNIPSACWHMSTPWSPEEESEEFSRINGVSVVVKGRKAVPIKGHWDGGSGCLVVSGKWAGAWKDRIFSGDIFDALPIRKRCQTCNNQFNKS